MKQFVLFLLFISVTIYAKPLNKEISLQVISDFMPVIMEGYSRGNTTFILNGKKNHLFTVLDQQLRHCGYLVLNKNKKYLDPNEVRIQATEKRDQDLIYIQLALESITKEVLDTTKHTLTIMRVYHQTNSGVSPIGPITIGKFDE